MTTIVAPTDFSEISKNAIRYAAHLALSVNAGLSLLYVYHMPMVVSEVPVSPVAINEILDAAGKMMSELKKELEDRAGNKLKIQTEVRTGFVIDEIISFCMEIDPFAIVMATHGAGSLERFLLGSNTISAIKHLSWPVIVVPSEAKFKVIRKIGIACDYQQVKKSFPLHSIKNMVHEFRAELFVVHVQQTASKDLAKGIIHEAGSLQEILGELNPNYDFIDGKDVEKSLAEFAVAKKLDILIVIPKKHGWMERLFRQSHSRKMVFYSPIPIMALQRINQA